MIDIIKRLDDAVERRPKYIRIGKTDKHEMFDSLGLPRTTRIDTFEYKGIRLIQQNVSSNYGEYRYYREIYYYPDVRVTVDMLTELFRGR